MSDEDHRKGFWYWMTLVEPVYYFFAKSLGGDAEKQADIAMEDRGPALVILVALIIVGVIVWGAGTIIGFW